MALIRLHTLITGDYIFHGRICKLLHVRARARLRKKIFTTDTRQRLLSVNETDEGSDLQISYHKETHYSQRNTPITM